MYKRHLKKLSKMSQNRNVPLIDLLAGHSGSSPLLLDWPAAISDHAPPLTVTLQQLESTLPAHYRTLAWGGEGAFACVIISKTNETISGCNTVQKPQFIESCSVFQRKEISVYCEWWETDLSVYSYYTDTSLVWVCNGVVRTTLRNGFSLQFLSPI